MKVNLVYCKNSPGRQTSIPFQQLPTKILSFPYTYTYFDRNYRHFICCFIKTKGSQEFNWLGEESLILLMITYYNLLIIIAIAKGKKKENFHVYV